MLYGAKPPAFTTFLQSLQQIAIDTLGHIFDAKPIHDIHATLIGLENAHLTDQQFGQLRQYINTAFKPPLHIQFGGFKQGDDYLFKSQNQQLFDRQIGIRGQSVVLIGWPIDTHNQPTLALEIIRRQCQAFGVTHKYHTTPDATDPDCYMVIGTMSQPLSMQMSQDFLARSHHFLTSSLQKITVSSSDCKVVTYTDTSLPSDTTNEVR